MIIVLPQVVHKCETASLNMYVVDSLFVSTSIKSLPVSLSFSSVVTHSNGLIV